ncbi:hypothetical protein PFISCL1PPCAC_26810, partial [Pristionchus fissidentatus]
MHFLLVAALVSAAFAAPTTTEPEPTTAVPEVEPEVNSEVDPGTRSKVVEIFQKHNISDEATAEFFNLHLDKLPITEEKFGLLQEWIKKWNANEIKELEELSNSALAVQMGLTIARRVGDHFAKIAEFYEATSGVLDTGVTAEKAAQIAELQAGLDEYALKMIKKTTRHFAREVTEEWGLVDRDETEDSNEEDEEDKEDEKNDSKDEDEDEKEDKTEGEEKKIDEEEKENVE